MPRGDPHCRFDLEPLLQTAASPILIHSNFCKGTTSALADHVPQLESVTPYPVYMSPFRACGRHHLRLVPVLLVKIMRLQTRPKSETLPVMRKPRPSVFSAVVTSTGASTCRGIADRYKFSNRKDGLAVVVVFCLFLLLSTSLSALAESAGPKAEKQVAAAVKPRENAHNQTRVRRGNAPCLSWNDPAVPIKAVFLCVHGLGLHNGTYEPLGKQLSSLGYPVYAIDVRGFGSWMEAKGRECVDFEGCLADIKSTLKVIRRAHPGKPVFLLGESMGGAIALRAVARYPELVDGLVSSVPAGDRFKQGQTSLKVALHFLAGPDRPMNVGESVIKQATDKPELRAAWQNDPLARMKLSPKELIQFQSFMNQNHESAREIKDKPVLIVQGVLDKLVRPEGTVELFNKLSTTDKEIALIPNGEHLIFEENQFSDQVVEKLVAWVELHRKNDASAIIKE